MSIELACSRCNHTIYKMRQLRSVKDIIRKSNRCPNCNAILSTDFSLYIESI